MEPNKLTKTPKACTIWVLLQPDFLLPLSFLSLWLLRSACWPRNPKSQGLCPCSFIYSLCHFVQSLLKCHFLRKLSLTTLYKIAPQLPHTTHCVRTVLLHNMLFCICFLLHFLSCTSQPRVSPFQISCLPNPQNMSTSNFINVCIHF